MAYYSTDKYTIIRKHYLIAILFMIRFVFFLLIALIIYLVSINYKSMIPEDVFYFVILPLVVIIVNYSFIKLILSLIEFYNYLIIINGDQIMILNASLIMRDDMEVIEAIKIIKLDAFCRGFVPNFLDYGLVTIELQTKEERFFKYIPKPYKLLRKLKNQRDYVVENRKNKYIVDDNVKSKKPNNYSEIVDEKKKEVIDIIQ